MLNNVHTKQIHQVLIDANQWHALINVLSLEQRISLPYRTTIKICQYFGELNRRSLAAAELKSVVLIIEAHQGRYAGLAHVDAVGRNTSQLIGSVFRTE